MSRGRKVALDRMRHMLTAATAVAGYVERGRAAFDEDAAILDALLFQIIVIGEAAKAAVGADPTIEHDALGVEWSPWARMRDRVTHQYWANDPEIVWSTASNDVPKLRAALSLALAELDR